MAASLVDQVQYGSSGQRIIDQYQAIINTTTPTPKQLQPRAETQPIVPSNETIIEPVTPPMVVTVPQSEQKNAGQKDSVSLLSSFGFFLELLFWLSWQVLWFIVERKPNY
jgi:hypothetical protein